MTADESATHAPSPRVAAITATALRLLQTEGPAAITMRRVAAELGIQAPSLYKHVKDKGVIEGLLQRHAMEEFAKAVSAAGPDAHAIAAAYRSWALSNPHLYELTTRKALHRDIVEEAEQRAAAPVVAAVGGDADKARALFAFAHGMVDLELNERFPANADLEAAWTVAVDALTAGAQRARRR